MKILFLFFILFSWAEEEMAEKVVVSPVRYKEYDAWLDTQFSLLTHKGTYLLPFTYNWKADDSLYAPLKTMSGNDQDFYQKSEAELQISFMIPVYRRIFGQEWDLFFAYTHHAWWQLYNAAWSKPFRETNYMPELFVRRLDRHPLHFLGFDLLAYDFGYVHHSNGQIQTLSRSWDRIFARGYFRASSQLFFILSGWIRMPEESDQDENTDILTYMGMGDVEMYYRRGKNSWSIRLPLASKPGVELRYSRSWTNNLRWYFNYRTGYGQSLVEYKSDVQRIGFGIALDNFFDREDSTTLAPLN